MSKPKSSKHHLSDTTPLSTEDLSIHYLNESPNTKSEKMRFGHPPIISALENMIKAARTSMTIGLFGGWGTGKSSIVENLRSALLISKIPVVLFDVWKHDGDALRRTFLQEMDNQLSEAPYGSVYVKEPKRLDKRVYSLVTKSEDEYKIKWARLGWSLMILACVVLTGLIIFSIYCLLVSLVSQQTIAEVIRTNQIVSGTGALLVSGLTGSVLFKFFDNFIKLEKTEEKKEKLQDPHEFEEEFHHMVENLRPEIDSLVVVFDNLDRISGDQVLKVMATIKTFLDYRPKSAARKVFFIIPCDVGAIKTHINSTLHFDDPAYTEEFLRKFFNANLWLPEFYENELEDFATEKLKETNVPAFQNDTLAWLIIKAFKQNPRQIIQFINILLSHYLLIKEYCEGGQIEDRNFYKSNVAELAKFLVLKMCFPEIIDFYQYQGAYKLDDGAILKKLMAENSEFENVEAFRELLTKTREIGIVSLEPFFKFRLSKDEQHSPELYQALPKIIDGDASLNFIDESILLKNAAQLSNMIRNRFNAIDNKIYKSEVLANVLGFTRRFKLNWSHSLYKDLLYYAVNQAGNELFKIDPSLIANELIGKYPEPQIGDIRYFLGTYLSQISQRGDATSLSRHLKSLDFLIQFRNKFSEQHLVTFNNVLISRYQELDFIKHVLANEDARQTLVRKTFRMHLLTNLVKPDQHQLNLIKLLDQLDVEPESADQTIMALVQIAGSVVGRTNEGEKATAVLIITKAIEKYLLPDEEKLTLLEPLISEVETKTGNALYVPMIILLARQAYLKGKIQTTLSGLAAHLSLPDLQELGQNLDINVYWEESSLTALFNRSTALPGLDMYLAEILSQSGKEKFILFLINNSRYEQLRRVWPFILAGKPATLLELHERLIGSIKTGFEEDIEFDDVKWVLLTILSDVNNYNLNISSGYLSFVLMLVQQDMDDEWHLLGLQVIKQLADLSEEQQLDMAAMFVQTIYACNYSTSRKVYEICFTLFEQLDDARRNQLRDLIYIHLFHVMAHSIEMLDLAVYTVSFEGDFNFKGCETYFTDFLITAKLANGTALFSYYVIIIKSILKKLRTNQSAGFREIKKQLKTFIIEQEQQPIIQPTDQ